MAGSIRARPAPSPTRSQKQRFAARKAARGSRLLVEPLEQRCLLDAGGLPSLDLQFGVASLTEGDSLSATITLSQPSDVSLTVTLAQSEANQFDLPTLTIPAGQTSLVCSLSTVSDTLIEKNKHVVITASTPGYADAARNIDLYDDDVPSITLSIDRPSASESVGAGAAMGTVTRDKVSDHPLKVYLSASYASRLGVPDTVTIPANQASISFPIATIDDGLIDPPQLVTVSAHGAYPECGCPIQPGAAATIQVTDAVAPTLTLSLGSTFVAEGKSTQATVTRNTDTSVPLVVQLAVADASQAHLPANVTIPAGARSAPFTLATLDDGTQQNRPQTTVSVTASGYLAGSASLAVLNVSRPTVLTASIPSAMAASEPGQATPAAIPSGTTGGIDFYATSAGLFRLTPTGFAVPLAALTGIDSLVPVGSLLYLAGDDGVHGRELWRSDGTVAGTYLVKDIQPGAIGSDIDHLTAVGSTLYFSADDGTHGNELWRSDGTGVGTTMVVDTIMPAHHLAFATSFTTNIDTDTSVPPFTPYFGGLDAADYTVTFAAAQAGLIPGWNNTDIIYHAILSTAGHDARDRLSIQGPVYNSRGELVANDAADLWDGSIANPIQYDENGVQIGGVLGVWTGTGINGTLGSDGACGSNWNNPDQRATGGLLTSSGPSWIENIIVACVGSKRLYGLSPLLPVSDASALPDNFTVVGGTLYYTAYTPGYGNELWKTDGTPGGTVIVRDIAPGTANSGVANLSVAGGKLWFTANDGTHGQELWVTDNTPEGAHLVADLQAGSAGSNPSGLVVLGNQLLFTADANANPGGELWAVDMITEATTLLTDGTNSVPYDTDYSNLAVLGTQAFFTINDQALFATDGTPAGTLLVKQIRTENLAPSQITLSPPSPITVVGSRIYFVADDGLTGRELWESDGTTPGTTIVKDIAAQLGQLHHLAFATSFTTNIDTDTSVPPFIPYFGGLDAADYTVTFAAAQAGLIQGWNNSDIVYHAILSTSGNDARDRLNIQGPVYNSHGELVANDAADLWDGSILHPIQYDENGVLINSSVRVWTGTAADGTLGSRGSCGSNWNEPNTITSGGLTLSQDSGWINGSVLNCLESLRLYGVSPLIASNGAASEPTDLVSVGGLSYFTADDGIHGRELWKTDGTTGGTSLVKDITAGGSGTTISDLTPLGSRVLFLVGSGPSAVLWESDGSDAGTHPVNQAATVAGRALFYNQSGTASPLRYDGNNAAINANDDLAIATDKSAYLPGTGAATFANVSSYTKGINGIMIDLAGTHGTITAADFIFRVGNNNTPNSWAAAPAPSSISVRAGAGVSGSDRITLTWANGAIAKKWLEVIVLANANTGLDQKAGYPVGQGDVFFFGNALADSGAGDNATQAIVNVTDELGARNNPATLTSNIPITNLYDYNRDGQVNTTDALAARNNPTSTGNVTRFITVANPPTTPEAATASDDGGVASALSAPARGPLASAGIPRWLIDRIGSVNLNSGPVARYLQHLADANTPAARRVLRAVDAVARRLALDDSLLESLLNDPEMQR